MKKYFIHNGVEQEGPFDINELRSKKINSQTLIWHEGLSDWTTANNIEEIKEILNSPPPFRNIHKDDKQSDNNSKKGSKKIILTIFISIFIIAIAVVSIVVINLLNDDNKGSESYHDKVMSIEEIEQSQPTNFLYASGTYNENFWGDKFKISCEIINKATVASYKDVIIRVTYYTKTKTKIGSEDHTIYEIFPPTSSKIVDLKVNNYKNVSFIDWEVINATVN